MRNPIIYLAKKKKSPLGGWLLVIFLWPFVNKTYLAFMAGAAVVFCGVVLYTDYLEDKKLAEWRAKFEERSTALERKHHREEGH